MKKTISYGVLSTVLCLLLVENLAQNLTPPENRNGTIYSIFISKLLRPGANIFYTISLTNPPKVLRLFSRFVAGDNETVFEDVTERINGSSFEVKLGAIPLDYGGSPFRFRLTVEGQDAQSGERIFLQTERNFRLERKALSIFIQTDKAIYQPGELIKFRALCLSQELTPLKGTVSYQVQDPKRNIVLQESNVTLSHGVANGELQLIRDSTEGRYRITFQHQIFSEYLIVEVRSYHLPKFEVEIEAPSFVHPGSTGISATLRATYTFGRPVEGIANINFRLRQRSSSRYKFIKRTLFPYDGEETVFISMDEIINDLGWEWDERTNQRIEIFAEVTESLTDTTLNDSTVVEAVQTNIRVEVLQTSENIKPGSNFQTVIQVSEYDGNVLMDLDREQNDLIVVLDYEYPRFPVGRKFPGNRNYLIDDDDEYQENTTIRRRPPPGPVTLVYKVPPSGIVPVNFVARNDDFAYVQIRVFTNATQNIQRSHKFWSAVRVFSPSDSFLFVTALGNAAQGQVAIGSKVSALIRTTEVVPAVRILIVARGLIVLDEQHAFENATSQKSMFSFDVTSLMTPNFLVLASYIRYDNEVVADFISISVAVELRNKVSLATSLDSIQAGDDVSIRVETSSAGSYVGLRAIDQSVLLLKSGNDITDERVIEDLNKYSITRFRFNPSFHRRGFWFAYSSGAGSVRQVFEEANINVLTNAVMPFPPQFLNSILGPFRRGPGRVIDSGNNFPNNLATGNGLPSSSTNRRVRSLFPETWIWTEGIADDNGSYAINVTAPDTITSWIISAFSISNDLGLGVADTHELTVFHEFFVTLNLPLKITQGEIIIVQAIVFNYLQRDLDISVILQLNRKIGIELLRPGSNRTINGPVRHLSAPSGGSVSIKFPLRITEVGEVPIRVDTFSTDGTANDAIERKVFVRPEGIQQCYSASTFISADEDSSFSRVMESLMVRIPPGAVSESENVKLHVYGEIMENTLNNLGRLLRSPGGCGEQNMIRFAPSVFVTFYLKQIMQLDDETQTKAFRNIRNGYVHELKFKRRDGSFSAFGEGDESGSTWLTAFIVKCFLLAQELRPSLIENKVIDEAMEFLVSQQTSKGSFKEPGKVIHRNMQGGVNSPLTMTAFVLIALTESEFAKEKRNSTAILNARAYLESQLYVTLSDPYALALMSYALQVSGSSMVDEALDALNAHVTEEGRYRYWHVDTVRRSTYSSRWRPPYGASQSNDIEMTSYALLTYVRRNDLNSAIPILTWLISKQNSLGGYSSTQDTVQAIQALSSVASSLVDRKQDLTISFTHSAVKTFQENVTITEKNLRSYFTFLIPPNDGNLEITASGTGLGVAQLSVCYNVPEDPFDEEPFNCTVDVNSSNPNSANVKFCCGLEKGREETGMFLFEIGLLNGFTVDAEREKEKNHNANMVELDDDSVNAYFDQLTPGGLLCATVELLRKEEVAGVKPATLSAYDYYQPDKRVSFLYNSQGLSETGVCEVCGAGCVGCPAPRLREWSSWGACFEFCQPEITTRIRNCVDPSLNKTLHISECNLETNPMEEKACLKPFRCPTSSLWFYLITSSFTSSPNGNERICSRRNYSPAKPPRRNRRRRMRTRYEIPDHNFNGQYEYARCRQSVTELVPNTTHYALKPFSVSVLLRPLSYKVGRETTFFEIGNTHGRPTAVFHKRQRRNELRFRIHLGAIRYEVDDIEIFPIGQWTHVILTWNNSEGPRVYVNGSSAGTYSKKQAKTNSTLRQQALNIGSSHSLSVGERGFFHGDVSAFKYWSVALPATEIQGLIDFYLDIIDFSDKEPILSTRQFRSFLDPDVQHCITSPNTLSNVIKNRIRCDVYG